jgi:Fe-S oxidoreductase
MVDDGLAALEEEILDSVERCFKCRMCVNICPTYKASGRWFAGSPIGRLLAINYHLKYRLGSESELSDLLFSCAICRRCQERCMAVGTGSDPADQIVKARNWLVKRVQIREGTK